MTEDQQLEEELITRIHRGDRSAGGILYDKIAPALRHSLLQLVRDYGVANEIVSDGFIKFWIRRENFPSIANIKAFLFTVCRNLALDYLKKGSRKEISYGFIDQAFPNQAVDPAIEAEITKYEFYDLLYEEINHLAPGQKAVIQLFLQGKSVKDICKELNLSEESVWNSKFKAVRRLRENMKGKDLAPILALLFL